MQQYGAMASEREYGGNPARDCTPTPLCEIEESLQTTGKILMELEGRLSPVLIPAIPAIAPGTKNPEPHNKLQEIRVLANRVQDHLQSIMRRIEL